MTDLTKAGTSLLPVLSLHIGDVYWLLNGEVRSGEYVVVSQVYEEHGAVVVNARRLLAGGHGQLDATIYTHYFLPSSEVQLVEQVKLR